MFLDVSENTIGFYISFSIYSLWDMEIQLIFGPTDLAKFHKILFNDMSSHLVTLEYTHLYREPELWNLIYLA